MISQAHYASRPICFIMRLQPLLNSLHSAIDRATVWCRNTVFEISSLFVKEAHASDSVQPESHQQEVYAAFRRIVVPLEAEVTANPNLYNVILLFKFFSSVCTDFVIVCVIFDCRRQLGMAGTCHTLFAISFFLLF